MDDLEHAVRRLELHQRVCWQRPRWERTLVCSSAQEAVDILARWQGRAREIEVYRAAPARYVVYLRM